LGSTSTKAIATTAAITPRKILFFLSIFVFAVKNE
jgi:hypothetical protein